MALTKITTDGLSDNAITADKIASGAVTVADIPDGEITLAKLHTVVQTTISGKANTSSLATVAASGSYADLTNKPTISATVVSDQTNASTGYFDLPAGTTAQRPSSPHVGMTRFNTTLNIIESYHNAGWIALSNTFQATGGTTADIDGYRYHTFTSSGTFIVQSGATTIDYLIVAGGGGGATDEDVGGGGGGGGLLSGSIFTPINSYSITVGAGGSGGTLSYTPGTGGGGNGAQGGTSSAFGLSAIGGGYGGTRNTAGGSGGSGGGGGDGATAGGSGTAGQGFAGGNGGGAGFNQNGGNDQGAGGGAGGAASVWTLGPGLYNAVGRATFSAGARGALTTAGASNSGNGGSNRAGGSGIVVIRYSI